MEIEKSEINQILSLLGHDKANIHLLGGYYNNVYEISSEVPIIVKVYNRELDNEETILSEIEWTQFLNENKVNVTIPIAINKKSYINYLTDTLFFVAYQKVAGVHIDPSSEEWNEKLFKQWGKGMGKMHSLSKMYKGKKKRPEWNEHKIFHMNLNSIDSRIKERWENHLKDIESRAIPKKYMGLYTVTLLIIIFCLIRVTLRLLILETVNLIGLHMILLLLSIMHRKRLTIEVSVIILRLNFLSHLLTDTLWRILRPQYCNM